VRSVRTSISMLRADKDVMLAMRNRHDGEHRRGALRVREVARTSGLPGRAFGEPAAAVDEERLRPPDPSDGHGGEPRRLLVRALLCHQSLSKTACSPSYLNGSASLLPGFVATTIMLFV
jgi:hypothetical protein